MKRFSLGFSSVEVLLSMLLLGIMSVVIFWGMYEIEVSTRQARMRDSALYQAQMGMETVHALQFTTPDSLRPGRFVLQTDDRGYPFLSPIESADTYTGLLFVVEPFQNFWKVTSLVTWTEYPHKQKSVSLFRLFPSSL